MFRGARTLLPEAGNRGEQRSLARWLALPVGSLSRPTPGPTCVQPAVSRKEARGPARRLGPAPTARCFQRMTYLRPTGRLLGCLPQACPGHRLFRELGAGAAGLVGTLASGWRAGSWSAQGIRLCPPRRPGQLQPSLARKSMGRPCPPACLDLGPAGVMGLRRGFTGPLTGGGQEDQSRLCRGKCPVDEPGPPDPLAPYQAPPAGTLAHSLACSYSLRGPWETEPFVLNQKRQIKSQKKKSESNNKEA